jgi:hypothetical protein
MVARDSGTQTSGAPVTTALFCLLFTFVLWKLFVYDGDLWP